MTSQPSHVAALKALIMQAWRERWSDMQWNINLKNLKTAIGPIDYSALADILLTQAMVGSTPNNILLSYLRHALNSQMISFSVGIKSIVKFEDINKLHCVRVLLEIIESFSSKLCVQCKVEDCPTLSRSILHLLDWLFKLSLQSLQRYNENCQATDFLIILEHSSKIACSLLSDNNVRALIYIARLEEAESFRLIEQTIYNIQGFLNQISHDVVGSNAREKLQNIFFYIDKIHIYKYNVSPILNSESQMLNLSVSAVLTQEAIINPAGDAHVLLEQLLMIEKGQGISRSTTICEIYRSCFLGLIDAASDPHEIKWLSFVALKIPKVLSLMHQSVSIGNDLEQGLNSLLAYNTLLDLVDQKCGKTAESYCDGGCDILGILMDDLHTKFKLMSDDQLNSIKSKRKATSNHNHGIGNTSQSQNQQSIFPILRAEKTVQRILNTINSMTHECDYQKNFETILGVLFHMLSGKSLELILGASVSTGRLQELIIKLVNMNEFAKQSHQAPTENVIKVEVIRGLLFDVTFLMLIVILQNYGTNVLLSCKEVSNSFVVQWVTCCMPEDGKYKTLNLLPSPDPIKVETLLQQLNPTGELKVVLTKWHEVCLTAPYSCHEILNAWEYGILSNDSIKIIIENIKGKMCCLPIVLSAWLCSYINTLDHNARARYLYILQELHTPLLQPPDVIDSDGEVINQFYTERANLMKCVQDRMIQASLPSTPAPSSSFQISDNTSAHTVLKETFRNAFNKGFVDLNTVLKCEYLYNFCGTRWFVHNLIKEVMAYDRVEDLNKGISLIYGIFHLDLENTTLSLLHHSIPSFMHLRGTKLSILEDPRGCALAKLSIMLLMVVHSLRSKPADCTNVQRGKKRTIAEVEIDELDMQPQERPPKLRRYNDELLSLHSEGYNLGDLFSAKEDAEAVPIFDIKDPLDKTLANLFHMFNGIMAKSQVNQNTGFILSFLREAVNAGTTTTRFILKFMPLNLVSSLMKCVPGEFDSDFLLQLFDLTSSNGRNFATRVIYQNAKFKNLYALKSEI